MHGNNGINGRGLQPVANTTSRLNDQQPAESKVFGSRTVVTILANIGLNVTLHASSSSPIIKVDISDRNVAVITIGMPYIPRPISSEARQLLFDRGTAALEEKGYSAQEAAVLAKKGMDWAESRFGSGSSQIENKFMGWINNAPQRADNRSLQTAPARAELETEIPPPPPPPPLPKVSIPSTSDEGGVLLARSEPFARENLTQTAAKPSMGKSVFIQPTGPLRENNLDDGGKALTKEREQHTETTASGGLDDLTGVRELFTETEDVSERAARKNTDTTTPTQITQDRENTESNSSAAKENLPSNEIPASTNAEVDTEIPTPPPPPPLPNASVPSNFRNDAKDTAESATNTEETGTTTETTNGAMQQAITDNVGNSSLDDEAQNIRRKATKSDEDGVLITAQSKSVGRENIRQTTKQSMGKPGFIQPIEPLWENNLDEDINGNAPDKNPDNTSPASTNAEVETKIPTPPPLPSFQKASRPSTPRNDAKDKAESTANAEEAGKTIATTNGLMKQAITDDVGNSSLDDETQNIRTEASTLDENGVLTARPKSAERRNNSPTAVKQSMGKPDFIQPIEPLRENNLDEDVNGSTDDKNADNTSPASTNPEVNTEIPTPPTPPPLPKASIPLTSRNDAKDTAESATNAEEVGTTIETTNGAMQQAITDDIGNSSLDDETQNIRKEASTSDENGVLTARPKSPERENISPTAVKQSMGKPDFIQPIEPLRENNLDEDVNGSTDDKNADNTSPASTNPEVNTEIPTPPTPPPLPKASIPLTSRNDAKDTAESATNAEEVGTTIETTNGAMQQAITDDIGNSSLDDETQNIRKEASTSDENGVLTARPKSPERENISPTAVKQSMGKPDFIQPIEPLRENNLDEDVNGSTDDKNADNTSPASTNPKINTEIPPPPPLPKAPRPSTPRNDAKDMGELATNAEDIGTTTETTNGVMPPTANDDDSQIIKSEVVTTSDEAGVSTARSRAAKREKNLEQASTTQLKERKQFKETKARGGIDDLTGVRELFTEPMDSGGLNDLTGITGLFTTNKSATSGRLQESTALNETNKLANDKQTVPAEEYTASDIHKNTTIIRKKAEENRETSPPQARQPKKTTGSKPKFFADSSASRKGPKIINRGLDLSGVESSKYARLSNQKTTASAGSKAHQQMVNDRKLLGVYSTSNELSVARSAYRKLQDNLSNLPQSKKIIDAARKYISESPTDQKPLLSKPNSSQLAALESLGLEESATEKIILMAMVDKASESIEQDKKYQHENFMKSLGKVHKVLFGKS